MKRVLPVVGLLLGVLGAVLHAVNSSAGRALEPSFWLLSVSAALGYGLLGLVLAGRVPTRLWVTVCGVALLFGGALTAAEWSLLADGSVWLLWLGSWAWAPGYVALVGLLPSLLPDGSTPPRPWRWAPYAGVLAVLAVAAWWALLPYADQDFSASLAGYENPVGTGLAATPAAEVSVSVLLLTSVVGAVGSLVTRWRRAAGVARQQLKWVLLGVGLTVLLLALARLLPAQLAEAVAAVGMLPLPGAIAVAALRHGLWEVDLVVSRIVGYAAVSVVAAAGCAALVWLVGTVGDEPSWMLLVVAVGLAAPLLVPVHTALQRRVNRWVHGQDDEPWTELKRLGDSLAAAAHPDELVEQVLPDVVARTRRALLATGVRLRLQDGTVIEDGVPPANPPVEVVGHTEDGSGAVVPLDYAGERLGVLEVARAGGFGRSEHALLGRLAAQAAVAVHTVLLVQETRRAREQVVLAREEERRRLRSDLHDGVGPSVAALALQLETARDLAAEDPVTTAAILSRLTPRINAVVSDVRALVHELRPPTLDELGLPAAVRELGARLSNQASRVVVEVEEVGELPAAVEVAAYRIMGEAVANAVRHAGATTVQVSLRRDEEELLLLVADDGRGFPSTNGASGRDATAGVGLTSMRHRAEELGGALEITSGPTGTALSARLPIAVVEEAS